MQKKKFDPKKKKTFEEETKEKVKKGVDPAQQWLQEMKKNNEMLNMKKIEFISTGSLVLNRIIGDGYGNNQPGGFPRALAQGRRLRRHVVGPAGDHQVAVRLRLAGQREERGDSLEMNDLQRTVDLKLLDVLRQIAAGKSQVNELPARQFRKLLQPRLHVMQGHALPFLNRVEVDDALDALVILDRLSGNRHAEVLLGLHHRDPEIPLQQDASLGEPDVLDRGRRVALGEHIGDRRGRRLGLWPTVRRGDLGQIRSGRCSRIVRR